MDVLYIIGGGSSWNNDELRYSLRSLKNCQDVDKVWIVGNKPAFLRNIEYLWVEDKFDWWKNAFIKTKAAIESGISKDFLLMNDDFFMLEPFRADDYPYYHKGELPQDEENEYRKVLFNTRRILEELGKTTYHFGVHCPIRINGEKYLRLEKYFNQPVSARCLYGNFYCNGVKIEDNKGSVVKTSESKCYSANDAVTLDTFKELNRLFPDPSQWEDSNV